MDRDRSNISMESDTMPQTITNQASLNYRFNGQSATAISNVASAVLQDPISIQKIALEDSYRAGDVLTYVITVQNSTATSVNNLQVTDDLGTYPFGTLSITPLTYLGPALLFLNGSFSQNVTPTVTEDSITFTLPTLAPNTTAQWIYRVSANEYAPLITDADITNTATVSAEGFTATASDTVETEDYADVTVNKSMSAERTDGGNTVTYQFLIENYGNAEATEVILSDSFNPAPATITVQLNGVTVSPDNYTYTGGVLTLPTGDALALSLPAATITQDITTGAVTVVPSSLTVTVVGTL